jgi:serine/threonine-protein kinase
VTPGASTYFPDGAFFLEDVSGAAPAAYSDSMIGALRRAGGWGNGDTFQIDFSIDVLHADTATPRQVFEPTDDFYDPDCDHVPVPIPVAGNIEGEDGYECTNDGDCHLVVFDPAAHTLYEMWRANITGGTF